MFAFPFTLLKTGVAPYVSSKSLLTNGIDQYCNAGTNTEIQNTNNTFTWAIWFQANAQNVSLVSRWSGSLAAFRVFFKASGIDCTVQGSPSGSKRSRFTSIFGAGATWRLAVVRFDGNELRRSISCQYKITK
jgi:hypothetical protein